MGIDIYLKWRGQTKAEEKAQCTGFSVTAGGVGYLREAYHGGPYATQYLVQEAFESKTDEAKIPARVLRQRLPATVMLALYREHVVYGENPRPGHVDVGDGDLLTELADMAKSAIQSRDSSLQEERTIAESFNNEQIRATTRLIETRNLPDYALAFVDFVQLAERKEAETGQPITVLASY